MRRHIPSDTKIHQPHYRRCTCSYGLLRAGNTLPCLLVEPHARQSLHNIDRPVLTKVTKPTGRRRKHERKRDPAASERIYSRAENDRSELKTQVRKSIPLARWCVPRRTKYHGTFVRTCLANGGISARMHSPSGRLELKPPNLVCVLITPS